MTSTDTGSYNSVAKALHWIIAWAIIAMLIIGWVMSDMSNSDPLKFSLFQWHKSIGITIMLLSIIRLGWRLTHKAPPLPEDMPAWEKFGAKATHAFFYFLIIFMPFTGWVIVSTSAMNIPTMLYGVIPWPHLPVLPNLENKRDIGHATAELHGFLAYVIVVFLVLHVAAAWKHHLFNRDDVLMRMAPSFLHPLLNRIRGT